MINVHSTLDLNKFRAQKLNKGELPPETITAYLDRLVMHIRYVQEAGKRLGVPRLQLEVHDQSKFSDVEFDGYAKHFCGAPPGAPDDFAKAWLHHIHHNPHHWQYWMFADGFSPAGSSVENGILEMPRYYALEMIADWMGASRAYTNSWDMTDWLHENMPRIKLHLVTARYMRETLDFLGYADVVHMQRWGHENE